MEILAIVGAVAALMYFMRKPESAGAAAGAGAQEEMIATPPTFSGGDAIVSGGYEVKPYTPAVYADAPYMLGKGAGRPSFKPADPSAAVWGTFAASAAALASTVVSPPVPAPPPAQRGGISGTVGTGGAPLGGPLRTGVSSGTGTTVVGTSRLQMLPGTEPLAGNWTGTPTTWKGTPRS